MAYYLGDIPAEDIVIEPARNGEAIDLAGFDDAAVSLRGPDGESISAEFIATLDAESGSVVVEWPGTTIFDTAGLYSLTVTLESDEGPREQLAPVYFVAQDDDGWQTLDSAREEWANAPQDDKFLLSILNVAKADVLAYKPLAEDTRPTDSYARAQLMHADDIWTAGSAQTGGSDTDSFIPQPRPLDWMVKQILRPKTGVPVMF